ncbi:MAG: NAD(P)-dependent oxidoreductase [Actinomycetota bacterium]|nr:NAD(P)-dependent oxidoreductase [Actinomycetota bacterium]
MPDRVLLTGATGFVGSHVARAFTEAGYEVLCGVRASSDLRWISGLDIERVPLDLRGRFEDLPRAVENVDLVVHAAGITRARRPEDYHSINAEGTKRLADAAVGAGGVRRFVLISSLAARGPDDPTKDGRDHPESAYGRSKLEAEAYLRDFDERIEAVVLRPAAVYGPRDTDLLPLFKLASRGWLPLPSGTNHLQPVYAEDVARAVLAAAREPVGFGPFPVAENRRYSWDDIVAGLEKALGRTVRAVRLPAAAFTLAGRAAEWAARPLSAVPVFDERRGRDLAVRTWTCDTSVTEQTLGWRAEVPLFEGLERTARWYRQAGWLSMKPR